MYSPLGVLVQDILSRRLRLVVVEFWLLDFAKIWRKIVTVRKDFNKLHTNIHYQVYKFMLDLVYFLVSLVILEFWPIDLTKYGEKKNVCGTNYIYSF